jgi:hypothetical protein
MGERVDEMGDGGEDKKKRGENDTWGPTIFY